MKNKEEIEALLPKDWSSLHSIVKSLKIQHYQAKRIIDELIAEGKVESCQFNKRTKYRRKIQVI